MDRIKDYKDIGAKFYLPSEERVEYGSIKKER